MSTENNDHGGLPTRRLLGLFAHPDDEVFCVGGSFAQAAADGAQTMVVSFTQGEAGAIRHADIATRSTLGQVRTAELGAACRELGVSHTRCLSFGDGQLAAANREQLVEAAVRIIRSFRPDQVYSFDLTGAYGHPDHIVMAEVARAACERSGEPAAFPDAGNPFAPSELLQARFPQNDRLLLRVLVDWLTSQNGRFAGSDEFTNALLMFADGGSMLGYASDHLSVQWFPAGSFILEQGAPAASLHLVLSGKIDVIVEKPDGAQTHVGSVGAGEFIGEAGIATGRVRNAHCVAAENTACFVLSPTARNLHAASGPSQIPTAREVGEKPALAIDLEVDVSTAVNQKVNALAEHRSQYVISPGLFPEAMVNALLGTEYFYRAWTSHSPE